MITVLSLIIELKHTIIKRGIRMDYNKWKRTPEEKRKRKISKKLVKYINETPLCAISIEKLDEIMRGK